ncbi:hypothetical protein F2Q70_00035596 [Brassica cretica]|uniref:Uncharacterized protein n=1 Tax=Brassica cretica TaxID=69181 RepID=A0A8S9JTZ5_BRACR|nr:hypothetical protein F2Q70_00035596 [Brassica cretica]
MQEIYLRVLWVGQRAGDPFRLWRIVLQRCRGVPILSRALDCDSAVWIGGSLTLGSLTSSKVAIFRRSNLQFNVPNDGTAYLWTLPHAAGLYPLLQGLRRLFLWELAATESLVPSHLSFRSSTLRYLRFIS